jgi:hypothetical protein
MTNHIREYIDDFIGYAVSNYMFGELTRTEPKSPWGLSAIFSECATESIIESNHGRESSQPLILEKDRFINHLEKSLNDYPSLKEKILEIGQKMSIDLVLSRLSRLSNL